LSFDQQGSIESSFQQGDDASLSLTILDRLGTRAAAHLAQRASERRRRWRRKPKEAADRHDYDSVPIGG
jgi:hypothetical protein